ncbi:hypothetical protein HOLleu_21687 [Holothuria leucospilota]|uniref:Uncharacterized protein n=1 Tax=Holothuria leucospilota TaxID=206669 RepID=A0A9Q1H681_HOLLE|nr:hypothetical protein HOLleu_21687 [Holothuria leucospilota]
MVQVSLRVRDKSIKTSESIRNRGVAFDSRMSISVQVGPLCTGLTHQLRAISRIPRFLHFDTCHLVIRVLVLSRLDYANGLLLTRQTSAGYNASRTGQPS